MIIRIVKLTLKPDRIDDFIVEFKIVCEKITSFEGCLHLELLSAIKDSSVVFTYSHWDSELSLEKYRSSPFFEDTWSTVKPMFAAKPEAWSLEQLKQ